ncbi:hypothetical protein [Flavobacterium caeni]|nr:hypothetical protein [Flavobacterium caeni]
MKTKILWLTAAFSLVLIGCNNDDDNPTTPTVPIATNDVRANSEMDDISDDVLYIAESESNEAISGRGGGNTFLAGCATINTEQDGDTWIRTIDFGDTNCTLFTGNQVRGKIILTFTTDFEAQTRTVSYAFDGFYHNDRKVEGNRTVVRQILGNGHPQATISLNLTVTATDGTVYNRVGERVREFTAGYDTPWNLFDNEFSITGSWVTSVSTTGQTYATTINTPLHIKWTCPHIVSGSVTVVRGSDGATAILDYGDGACDDDAVLTINGIAYDINL